MKRKNKYINTKAFILLLFVGLVFNSCKTSEDKFLNRTYHGMTTHFNGYFNGKESLKQGVVSLEDAHEDNFQEILNIFQLGTEANALSIVPQMERAMEKSSNMIYKHSMRIRNKQKNVWIDDCFFLTAQARFYKREYPLAKQSFIYVRKEFKGNLQADATLWVVRCNNEMGDFEESLALFADAEKENRRGNSTRNYKKLYPMVYADFYLKQNQYDLAIPFLEKAIDANRKKDLVIRLNYILAQVYQREGRLEEARETYKKVINKNPEYLMAFNAQINMAWCFDPKYTNSKDIEKELIKMLDDKKNLEYKDQIYYALGELSLRDYDTTKAITYLIQSTEESVNNDLQKTLSFKRMADVFFVMPEYIEAGDYYDSTLLFMETDNKYYEEIDNRSNNLDDLVIYLKDIELQDSLLHLSTLSPEKQRAIVDDIIAEIAKREEELRLLEIQRQRAATNAMMQNQSANIGTSTQWILYNPQTVSFGQQEFKRVWGDRKLEDLWRLSNKQVIDFGNSEFENLSEGDSIALDSAQSVVAQLKKDQKDPQFYLAQIPNTEEQKERAHALIEPALFYSGLILRNRFEDIENAIGNFKRLLRDYPQSSFKASSYYQLYNIYKGEKMLSQASSYKQKIISEFPESEYAEIIQNPNYYKELAEKMEKSKKYYEQTFSLYSSGDYNGVITNCKDAHNLYQDDKLLPKFDLLKAQAIGATKGKDDYINALNDIVSNYIEGEERALALEILSGLTGASIPASNDVEPGDEFKSIYTYKEGIPHYFIAVVNTSELNIHEIKTTVSNYDKLFFGEKAHTINTIILKADYQIITVTSFNDEKEALLYYQGIFKDPNAVKNFSNKKNVKAFVISTDNYTLFYKDKGIDAYELFFEKKYLNKTD